MALNNFNSKEVSGPRNLGEVLLWEREKRRYTLEQAAKALNVRQAYLENLEKNEIDQLPADIYARNYLRKYANFLHLPEREILFLYEREKKLRENLKEKSGEGKITREKDPSFSFVLTPRLIKISAVLVLVIFFLIYLWYQVSDLSAPPKINIIEPSAAEQTLKEKTILVVGETSPDAALTINGQPIHLNSEGKFQENISLQKGINVLRFEVKNRLGKKQTVEKKILVEEP